MASNSPNNNKQWMQYAGLAGQFLVSIGVGVFLGLKLDRWLKFKIPLFIWILPLLIIAGMMLQLIKDTSRKK